MTLTRTGSRRRPRSTGPTQAQRDRVARRAAWSCEVCCLVLHDGTSWVEPHSFHHRRPRGMGGTTQADANAAYQLLLVCGTGTTGCHGEIESNRQHALDLGWLVSQHADPATTPVWVGLLARHVLLTADGDYREDHHQ